MRQCKLWLSTLTPGLPELPNLAFPICIPCSTMLDQTHKFESRYLMALLFNPNPSPEGQNGILKEGSSIHSADQIKAPPLILSGADDNVVLPNQAYMLANKIGAGGKAAVEVEVILYAGEGHNFAQVSTLKYMEVRHEMWFRKHLVGQ